MDEDTLALFRGHFDKVEDILGRFIILVEENLAFHILPKEGQVDNAKTLPLVLDLLARAIDYP